MPIKKDSREGNHGIDCPNDQAQIRSQDSDPRENSVFVSQQHAETALPPASMETSPLVPRKMGQGNVHDPEASAQAAPSKPRFYQMHPDGMGFDEVRGGYRFLTKCYLPLDLSDDHAWAHRLGRVRLVWAGAQDLDGKPLSRNNLPGIEAKKTSKIIDLIGFLEENGIPFECVTPHELVASLAAQPSDEEIEIQRRTANDLPKHLRAIQKAMRKQGWLYPTADSDNTWDHFQAVVGSKSKSQGMLIHLAEHGVMDLQSFKFLCDQYKQHKLRLGTGPDAKLLAPVACSHIVKDYNQSQRVLEALFRKSAVDPVVADARFGEAYLHIKELPDPESEIGSLAFGNLAFRADTSLSFVAQDDKCLPDTIVPTQVHMAGCMFGAALRAKVSGGSSDATLCLVNHQITKHIPNGEKIENVEVHQFPHPYEAMMLGCVPKIFAMIKDLPQQNGVPRIHYHLPGPDYIVFGLHLYLVGLMARSAFDQYVSEVAKRYTAHRQVLKSMAKDAGVTLHRHSPFANVMPGKDPAQWTAQAVIDRVGLVSLDGSQPPAPDDELLRANKRQALIKRLLHLCLDGVTHRNENVKDVAKAWREALCIRLRIRNEVADVVDASAVLAFNQHLLDQLFPKLVGQEAVFDGVDEALHFGNQVLLGSLVMRQHPMLDNRHFKVLSVLPQDESPIATNYAEEFADQMGQLTMLNWLPPFSGSAPEPGQASDAKGHNLFRQYLCLGHSNAPRVTGHSEALKDEAVEDTVDVPPSHQNKPSDPKALDRVKALLRSMFDKMYPKACLPARGVALKDQRAVRALAESVVEVFRHEPQTALEVNHFASFILGQEGANVEDIFALLREALFKQAQAASDQGYSSDEPGSQFLDDAQHVLQPDSKSANQFSTRITRLGMFAGPNGVEKSKTTGLSLSNGQKPSDDRLTVLPETPTTAGEASLN